MAYTKMIARHDKITFDGTDVSNSFREFGFSSEHSTEDVTGFSATGTVETVPGVTTQTFTGEAFYTEELGAIERGFGGALHPLAALRHRGVRWLPISPPPFRPFRPDPDITGRN